MITQVLKIDPNEPQFEYIVKAADILRQGGLVVFPTETVYGLGANFFDKDALKRLREAKQRPPDKPFTVQVADVADIERFECEISPFASELISQFWPGPLTLIFNTAKSGKLGIRLPNNRIARELIRQSNTLIAVPSANISGLPAPSDAGQVLAQFNGKVDLILDAGETPLGRESTVIDLAVFPYEIVRDGAIPKDKIAQAEFNFWKNKISPTIKKLLFVCTGNSCRSVMAEGYLKKRLRQIEREDIEVSSRGVSAALLPGPTPDALEVLKPEGIDMTAHTPTTFTADDIKTADLILVMEEFQRDEVLDKFSLKKDRVYLLAEFGLWGGRTQDTPLEIPDPIGRPIGAYKESFNMIKNSIERLIKILI